MTDAKIFQIIIILLGIIIVILVGAGIYFYRLAIHRSKKEFLRDDPDLVDGNLNNPWATDRDWLDSRILKKIIISSYDGLTLSAHYLAAPRPTPVTAILVHGYTGKGKDMAAIARYYYETHGFNVLLPDCRGHGESEGNYIGFGWHDRLDILRWIDYIIDYTSSNASGKTSGATNKSSDEINNNVINNNNVIDKRINKDEIKIILHGVSMGGATVLMTSGENLPPNVKLIVSDCAYTSVKDILSYQMRRMYKLPPFPLIQITSLICKLRAGYSFEEASALSQVQKSKVPILFIHGSEDKFVPTEMAYKLYEAANCKKHLFIVENASHGNAYWTDMEGYKKQVESFLEKFVLY